MSKNALRVGLTALLVVASLFAFWPTFNLWTMSDADKKAISDKDPGALLHMQQKAIRLGLDLQGGIHVVMRVKMEELNEEERKDAVDRAIEVIRNRIDALGVAEPIIVKEGTDRISIDLPGYTDASHARELIGQTALLEFKLMESYDNATFVIAKIDSIVAAKESGATPATSTPPAVPPLVEPATASNDSADILKQLMGNTDTGAATKDEFAFEEPTATTDGSATFSSHLELGLSNQRTGMNWPGFIVAERDKEKIERWLALPEVQGIIPVDIQFAWSTRPEIQSGRQVYWLYVLKRKAQFVGKYLESVVMGQDNIGAIAVDFTLNDEGAAIFGQLTGSNIDKPLAIMLDNRVESAPMINSKIRNRGQITMGSSATFEDARDLSIVLKAGALPAPVEIIAQNVVGATLGSDSIKKGFWAALIGLLLVLAYIAFYYRVSGLIADIGLLFNLFFLLAVMAALGATLTMPGIAGIILTIGMSVDSNILIFERIREELIAGKSVRAAIDAGYDRAWVAILDSHVTTLITAGALFLMGSGTIKGFAVSLFWGVLISLFTAYVITKLIFDFRKNYKTLSI